MQTQAISVCVMRSAELENTMHTATLEATTPKLEAPAGLTQFMEYKRACEAAMQKLLLENPNEDIQDMLELHQMNLFDFIDDAGEECFGDHYERMA